MAGEWEDDQDNIESSMTEELSKGSSSSVPEDALAGISLSKDLASGAEPFTRESLAAALSGDLGNIAAKKADLYQRLKTGGNLSTSQTVGLGILALGLMAAGGAIRGKKGLGMAGKAFNTGGQLFLKQTEKTQEDEKDNIKTELSALNSKEASLSKAALDNKMAPVKAEETIAQKLKYKKMEKAAGLSDGGTNVSVIMPDNMSSKLADSLTQTQGSVDNLMELADELEKLPSKGFKDWATWQGRSRIDATEEGKLANRIRSAALQRAKVDAGGRPSAYLEQIEMALTQGDATVSPSDVAALLKGRAGELAASAASAMQEAEALRAPGGLRKRATELRKLADELKAGPGDPTFFKSLMVDEGSASTEGADVQRKLATLKDGSKRMVTKDEFDQLKASGDI